MKKLKNQSNRGRCLIAIIALLSLPISLLAQDELIAPIISGNINGFTNKYNVSISLSQEQQQLDSYAIKYSIDYVDESLTDVTNETYDANNTPSLDGPCTLTAWVVVDTNESPVATAYCFGVLPNPMKYLYGAEAPVFETPRLVPVVDGVSISSYYSPGTFASTANNGSTLEISGLGSGMATAILSLPEDNVRTFTAINDTAMFKMEVAPEQPTLSLKGGTYDESQTVTISSDYVTNNSQTSSIEYYLGEEVPESLQTYSNALNISETTTLNARVRVSDEQGASYYSDWVSADYVIQEPVSYGIIVNGETVVNQRNMLNVLGDEEVATVIYNGNGTLILNGFEGTIQSTLTDDLTLYLKGENNVTSIMAVGATAAPGKLIIATDKQAPGRLTLGEEGEGVTETAISGFAGVELKNDLTWLEGSATATHAIVGPYIKPIVEEKVVEKPKADDLDLTNVDESEQVKADNPETDKTIIINKVVDEVLYTLEVQDNVGGKVDVIVTDEEEDKTAIVLNTTVDNDGIAEALTKEPGTADFAKAFEGVTFKLAAGAGNVKLDIDATGGILAVKIGTADPTVFEGVKGEVTVPYVLTEAAYVYIYNATPATSPSRRHRAKVKSTPVRMYSVEVTPEAVTPAVEPEVEAVPAKPLTSTDVAAGDITTGAFAVDDATITKLSDGIFDGKALKSIDLTKTSVTGITVDRSSGAFQGVSRQTFIYLPAGNDAGTEPNVIIGGVCSNMQLTSDDQQFAPAIDFGAASATLDRNFVAGQTSTVFLPFGLDKAAADALGQFFTFKGIKDGEAELEPVTTGLAANTPYIYKKSDNGKITVKNVTVKKGEPTASQLIGTYEPFTFPSEMISEASAGGKYFYGYAAADEGDIKAGEFVHTLGDAHIYNNHIEQCNLQLTREPRPLPTMLINPAVDDIFGFVYEDFTLENYNPHPHIKGEVSV